MLTLVKFVLLICCFGFKNGEVESNLVKSSGFGDMGPISGVSAVSGAFDLTVPNFEGVVTPSGFAEAPTLGVTGPISGYGTAPLDIVASSGVGVTVSISEAYDGTAPTFEGIVTPSGFAEPPTLGVTGPISGYGTVPLDIVASSGVGVTVPISGVDDGAYDGTAPTFEGVVIAPSGYSEVPIFRRSPLLDTSGNSLTLSTSQEDYDTLATVAVGASGAESPTSYGVTSSSAGTGPTAPLTAIALDDPAWTTPEIVLAAGYPCETHTIQTEDGYILTVFRIPGGKNEDRDGFTGRPFWLQHGLVGSSDQWVQLGPDKALAFQLADAGYDVWLGNSRGNRYSQESIYTSVDDPAFWDFSWDEMGLYDIPAGFDYVKKATGEKQVYYAGHSMGTAMLMVCLSVRSDCQQSVRMAFTLAPAVFVGHSRSLIFNYFCGYLAPFLLKLLGPVPLLPKEFSRFQNWFYPRCSPDHPFFSALCRRLYVLTSGPTTDLSSSSLPTFWSTNPSQTSVKTLVHYGQSIQSGEFRAFDYGQKENLVRYKSPESPSYHLKNVTTPVVIMFADDDYIAPPYDEYKLCLSLGNPVFYYRVPRHTFDHMDFLYGESARTLVYDKILQLLQNESEVINEKAICFNDSNITN